MGSELFILIKVFYWLLVVGVIFLPRRLAFISFLIITHIDMSGPRWASPSTIGIENSIKIILLPTVLLIRANISIGKIVRLLRNNFVIKIWLVFCAYVTLTCLWSPAFVSSLKLLGYLYSYTILQLVALVYLMKGLIDIRSMIIWLWGGLFLAILQTYFIRLSSSLDAASRLTSFTSPQYFAVYLVVCAAFLFFLSEDIARFRLQKYAKLSFIAIFVANLGTGSRYALTSFIICLLMVWVVKFVSAKSVKMGSSRLLVGAAGIVLTAFILTFALVNMPGSRLNELVTSISKKRNLSSVGNWQWRVWIYERALNKVANREMLVFLVGNGTSSGSELFGAIDSLGAPITYDANRVFHNVYVRCIYEWGLIGLILFVTFLLSLIVATIKGVASRNKDSYPIFVTLPLIVLGLSVENLIPASGAPPGASYVLLFAYLWRGYLPPNYLFKKKLNYGPARTANKYGAYVGKSGARI